MSRRLLRAGTGFAASLLLCAEALADEEPRWSPGDRTTSSIQGEVVPDDSRHDGDGVYGRLDGDLSLGLGLGLNLGGGTHGTIVTRALYYQSVGLFVGYSDTFGRDAAIERAVFFGAEVRPLFLTRWSNGLELGQPMLDLTLDSLALELGALAAKPDAGELGDAWGMRAALGFGIPLLARADGPWLEARGALRTGMSNNPFELVLLLSLYGSVLTPIVN